MPTITVDINPGEPCLKITTVDGSVTFIRNENIISVVGNQTKENLQIDGSFDKLKNTVTLNLVDGRIEVIDIADVSNQPSWTDDLPGLGQALEDIANGTESQLINFSIQGYDSQSNNELSNTTLANFDRTDAFSIAFRFRYDSATEARDPDATVFMGNRTAAGRGWQIVWEPSSNKWRFRFSNSTTNEDIVRFQASGALVVDDIYEILFTHDGAGNYGCIVNGSVLTPSVDTNTLTLTTVSTNPVRLALSDGLTSVFAYYGMYNDIMFCDKVLSQSEFDEFRNTQQVLDDYTGLSYNANVLGYFHANDGAIDSGIMKFPNQVTPTEYFGASNSRDYFQRPYDIYNWNPNPTINATNYVNNPIVDGTSGSAIESYAGDVCTAPDGDIVAVVKSPNNPFTGTAFYIFKGVDFDSLVEINNNTYPFPNWPVNEVGTIRIRREGNTYYIIARRQLNGSIGGAGDRDICILETTDLTTNPNTWTQHLGLITKSMIPYEATGTGDWGLMSPSDMFQYEGKYYMTVNCGNLLDYCHLFESNSITSGWSWKKTLFSVNEQNWLNTLSPSVTSANLVQGGSIIKDGAYYYYCATYGMENSDNKNERYLALGRGKTPFDFEFYKTALLSAGADGTYSERRVYDGQFIKKSDGNWLEPELIDSKYWLSYSGHSYKSNRPQAWDSNGKLSLMSWTPNNLIT